MKQNNYNIEDINLTHEDLMNKPYISSKYKKQISEADIVVLPHEKKREGLEISYPEHTMRAIDYLKSSLDIDIQYAVDDEEYQELQLHSIDITIPVLYVAKGVALNLVSSVLYDWLKGKFSKENPTVKCEVLYRKDGSMKKVKYEGPLEGMKEMMNNE